MAAWVTAIGVVVGSISPKLCLYVPLCGLVKLKTLNMYWRDVSTS